MHEKFEKTQTGDACGIGDVIKLPSPFSHTQTHTHTQHTHTHTHILLGIMFDLPKTLSKTFPK